MASVQDALKARFSKLKDDALNMLGGLSQGATGVSKFNQRLSNSAGTAFKETFVPTSREFQQSNRQFAQLAKQAPENSARGYVAQGLEGLRSMPGMGLIFRDKVANAPQTVGGKVARLTGASLPAFTTAGVLGGGSIAGNMLRATPGIAAQGTIGAGVSKLFGGDPFEGATKGISAYAPIRMVSGITNPLITNTAGRLGQNIVNPATRGVINRGVTGLLSIPEGMIMNRSLGIKNYTPTDALLDVGIGAVTGGANRPRVEGIDGNVYALKNKNIQEHIKTLEQKIKSLSESGGSKTAIKQYQKAIDNAYREIVKNRQMARKLGMKAGIVGDTAGKVEFNTDQYIREQAAKQSITPDNISFKTKADNTLQSIKTKFEDFTTPIETALNRAEKAGKFKILPQQDIRYQIDKVLRADSLGTQFIKDNGLADVIKNTDNLDGLNQYLIAKQATDVSSKGIRTGRDLTSDKQLIESLGSKYEPVAQQIYAYNAKLRNYLVESGLISQDLSDALAKEYPNYVPLKRIFTEVEQSALKSPSGRGGPASIGSQNVVKRLKGSEREIVNPLESLLESTGVAFREGERNKGARMLGGYIKNGIIPGKEVKGTIGAKHTVSFLDNGVKKTYEVSPDIAAAAKDLNADQLSKALKIIAVPARVLQLGATGVNVPFIIGNLVKDQLTASVISKKPLSTSIINPINFVKALFSAVKHDNLYADWIRSGSSFTSFDIARGSAPSTIASIRSNKNVASKVKYLATNPGQLFRALEDIVGTTENLTRIQQYAGTKNALLKEGRTLADAELMAGAASRTNTANFARKGEYGKVLNAVIPFFNAGIQGARSLRQSFISDPKGTSLRFTAFVGTPIAAATLWNVSNYERKAAYEDIQDYEKEGNIIIMPEKPVKDENGNYDAIKIPITPGLANLGSIIRRQIEGAGANPQEAMRVLSDLSAAGTSFELPTDGDSVRKLANQFTPQGLKLGLEPILNKNFYTGEDIVPSYMTKLPASEQVRDKTSGTARIIGGVLNTSPLKVENFVSSSGAGTGRQLLNLSDRVLANQGVIPQEQVGGRSVTSDIQSRFVKVRGGKKLNDLYEAGLTTKQIDKLLAEEEATAPRFSNSREQSPEAPKTIMDKISLAAKGITVDPQNTIKAIFTEEVMRKITNDALIFERKTNINPGDNGLEYDHIIPLSLGGDNSPENLLGTDPKIKAVKDKLEKQLWRQLDSGKINKEEAQRQIRQFIADNGVGEPISAKTKDYVASLASKKTAETTKNPTKTAKVAGKGVFILKNPETGSETVIDLSQPITKPTPTGLKELDTKARSSYYSKIGTRITQIYKLYEDEQLTAEEANKLISILKSQQARVKTKKASGSKKKAQKLKIKAIKAPNFQQLKPVQLGNIAPKVQQPKINIQPFKVQSKPLALRLDPRIRAGM
jgi:hypothetical protein